MFIIIFSNRHCEQVYLVAPNGLVSIFSALGRGFILFDAFQIELSILLDYVMNRLMELLNSIVRLFELIPVVGARAGEIAF